MSRTITIKIPVLVDGSGNWVSNGWSPRPQDDGECHTDWGLMDDVLCDMHGFVSGSGTRRIWVTAEVPLPEVEEVICAALGVEADQ